MHLRKIIAVLPMLSVAPICLATPSIDFVNQEGSIKTYERVQCVAKHSGGQSITAQGRQDSGASVINLRDLLAGPSGQYQIRCTATPADGSGNYSAEFEAVKFPEGTPGSQAPEYDENRVGYGVRTPARSARTACYDPNQLVLRQECLNSYSGAKAFYLESSDSSQDVRFKYRTEYSSNVGVFLDANPRYSGVKSTH